MVSIQNRSPLLSSIYQSSAQSLGKPNTKIPSNSAFQTELIQFSTRVKTTADRYLSDQNALIHFNQLSAADKAGLMYNDAPISELSADQALDLIGEEGYFGVNKTARRIIDFVITGAGDDLERLKAGREGILRGFAEAEKAWGGTLPEISYDTLSRSLATIDEKIRELGGSVVDLSA